MLKYRVTPINHELSLLFIKIIGFIGEMRADLFGKVAKISIPGLNFFTEVQRRKIMDQYLKCKKINVNIVYRYSLSFLLQFLPIASDLNRINSLSEYHCPFTPKRIYSIYNQIVKIHQEQINLIPNVL